MRIGIDLGGTKIAAIALGHDGRELLRRRIDTPKGDYAATIRAVAGLVTEVETTVGTRGSVGLGIPGIISPASGLVKNANSTWLIGHPLDRDVSELLGRPVRVDNDANCLAVSEATDGAGAGEAVVFAVILGTGVGGGLVVHGHPVAGRQGIAGEWGHNQLPPSGRPEDVATVDAERPGPACYCGRWGCIETWLSGPGVAADHARRTGETLGADALFARAEDGEPAAAATVARYLDRLTRGLATVINLLDPSVIVLGGGVSKAPVLYRELPARLEAICFSDRIDTPIRPARHGDDSGVRGAAWLWRPGETT